MPDEVDTNITIKRRCTFCGYYYLAVQKYDYQGLCGQCDVF